jgi:hypothetical protein
MKATVVSVLVFGISTTFAAIPEVKASRNHSPMAFADEVEAIDLGVEYPKDISGNSYTSFSFTTGPEAGPHTISLNDVGSDVGWDLYTDGFDSYVMGCDEFDGATDEACSVELEANTTYNFYVDEWSGEDSKFTVVVDKSTN